MIAALLCLLIQIAQGHDPAFLEAVRLHRAGKLAEAVEGYRGVLKTSPGSLEARSNLGAALAALGRYDDAIGEYRRALQAAPAHPALRLNLALAYMKSQRLTEAVAELNRLPEATRQELQPALLLANCRFQLGDYPAVIAQLEPLQSRHGDDPAFIYLLGTALIREGRVREGEALADRILRRGESPEARLMLGSALLRAARFDDAIREFERAVALNPQLPTVHALIAQARHEAGEREGAREAWLAELAIDPNNYDANFGLGVLLREDRRYAEALPYLRKARQLRPDAVAPPYQIAQTDLAAGRFDQARIGLEALIRTHPNFAEAHAALANAYLKLNRHEDARRARDTAARLASGPR